MQNLLLNNMTLADEFLRTAYGLCKTDPLLLNEMGVVLYHQEKLAQSVQLFTQALTVAEEIESSPEAWVSTRSNLGHALRRLQRFPEALEQFEEALRLGGKDPQLFCAKGLCLLECGEPFEAVNALHEALAMSPQDAVATDLLSRALEETIEKGLDGVVVGAEGDEIEAVDEEWEREIGERVRDGRRRRERGKERERSTVTGLPAMGERMTRGRGRGSLASSLRMEDSLMELSSDDIQ
jgi:anaphase-promoting complex subunit 6